VPIDEKIAGVLYSALALSTQHFFLDKEQIASILDEIGTLVELQGKGKTRFVLGVQQTLLAISNDGEILTRCPLRATWRN